MQTFAKLIHEHIITAEEIFNADETGLYWWCLPQATAAADEKQTSGFKEAKNRVTVLLTAMLQDTSAHR